MAEWFLFLPQLRIPVADIVERARVAEANGFDGVAFIDHLEAPASPGETIWEAMGVATWVAAKTDRLTIGHLVLCDAFRHPAVLAKQAVTLAEATGGRFELGLGSGSYPPELERFDVGDLKLGARIDRLSRDLKLIHEFWGLPRPTDRTQEPLPTQPIPLVIAGTGPRMMGLVREYAQWWNLQCDQIGKLPQLRPHAGSARVSVQQMVGFVRRGGDRDKVIDVSNRRFGYLGAGLVCGDAAELGAHFASLADKGVERFYVWFADFAAPASLEEFAGSVIAARR
ncbi:MAG: LLM class flavin-dependent oxidoreductase [Mycobacteriaceae bacterium]|nr:LLM class flavin-dependent oxidoreductase [Mycobacteriaceae bacterium]